MVISEKAGSELEKAPVHGMVWNTVHWAGRSSSSGLANAAPAALRSRQTLNYTIEMREIKDGTILLLSVSALRVRWISVLVFDQQRNGEPGILPIAAGTQDLLKHLIAFLA